MAPGTSMPTSWRMPSRGWSASRLRSRAGGITIPPIAGWRSALASGWKRCGRRGRLRGGGVTSAHRRLQSAAQSLPPDQSAFLTQRWHCGPSALVQTGDAPMWILLSGRVRPAWVMATFEPATYKQWRKLLRFISAATSKQAYEQPGWIPPCVDAQAVLHATGGVLACAVVAERMKLQFLRAPSATSPLSQWRSIMRHVADRKSVVYRDSPDHG